MHISKLNAQTQELLDMGLLPSKENCKKLLLTIFLLLLLGIAVIFCVLAISNNNVWMAMRVQHLGRLFVCEFSLFKVNISSRVTTPLVNLSTDEQMRANQANAWFFNNLFTSKSIADDCIDNTSENKLLF